jgi:hypothetical protein
MKDLIFVEKFAEFYNNIASQYEKEIIDFAITKMEYKPLVVDDDNLRILREALCD